MSAETLPAAAARIASARRLLVGTAAGMSVESGVPVYRQPGDTAWKNYGSVERLGVKAEDLACPQAFEERPALASGFMEWKRRLIASA